MLIQFQTSRATSFKVLQSITSKRRLGQPDRPCFLNPECVRILWVLAPKIFFVKDFRVQKVLPKKSLFRQFPCHDEKIRAVTCALSYDATDIPHPSFNRHQG